MRKLFGLIIGILAITAVVFLALPLSISFWMKSHYQRLINSINKSPDIALKVVEFDRGWFTSEAKVQVTIKKIRLLRSQENTFAPPRKPIQFIIKQRIKNGPWIFGNNEFLSAKALIHTISSNPNFKFHSKTIIHFGNTVDNTFSAKSITITNGQKQVVINNANSHVIFASKTQHMTSETSIGSMTLFEKDNTAIPGTDTKKLVLSNVKLNSDIKYIKPLWYGDRSITVDKSTYFSPKKDPLTISHIIIGSKQSQVNNTTASLLTAHANSITGKDLNLAPIDLKFSIKDIDTASLDALINATIKLGQSIQFNKQQLKTLYPFSVALLSKGFTATLHYLKFGTPEGPVDATAQITLAKQSEATTNIFSFLQNTTAEVYLQMPLDWFKRHLVNVYKTNIVNSVGNNLSANDLVNKQMQTWISNKKLIQDGQNVKITITFKDGKLLINGLPPSYQASAQIPTAQAVSIETTTTQQQ